MKIKKWFTCIVIGLGLLLLGATLAFGVSDIISVRNLSLSNDIVEYGMR